MDIYAVHIRKTADDVSDRESYLIELFPYSTEASNVFVELRSMKELRTALDILMPCHRIGEVLDEVARQDQYGLVKLKIHEDTVADFQRFADSRGSS